MLNCMLLMYSIMCSLYITAICIVSTEKLILPELFNSNKNCTKIKSLISPVVLICLYYRKYCRNIFFHENFNILTKTGI